MATVSSEICVHDQSLHTPFSMHVVVINTGTLIPSAYEAERQCKYAWQGSVSSKGKGCWCRCHTASTVGYGMCCAGPNASKVAEQLFCGT